MRHRWFPACAVLAMVFGLAPAAEGSAPGRVVDIAISNFRFCSAAPCQPQDQAYVRAGNGNVPGTDNPPAFIEVHPGDTVVWTYQDGACDALTADPRRCPGHEVVFEPQGKVGFLPARRGKVALSWRVPDDAAAGHRLRYYCDLDEHWAFGLTGGLRVAGH